MTKQKKTKTSAKTQKNPSASSPARKWQLRLHTVKQRIIERKNDFLSRRPHRTFRSTRRRDYARPLAIPGYIALTQEVAKTLWSRKALFILLAFLYALLSAALVGLASQSTYEQLQESFDQPENNPLQGNLGELGKTGMLLLSGITGSLNETPTDVQRIFATILGLMVWLTTVWLLRAIIAGKKPRLRDGLYNSATPLLSTFFVSLIIVIQLIPVAIAVLAFSAAAATGLIEGGVESMVFWTCAALLGALSLYWIVGSFFALVVVTLPGMYPLRAIKIAGDLIVGRRIRVVLRFLWLLFTLVVGWIITVVPIIFLDKWIKAILSASQGMPIVPIWLVFIAALSVVWSASYTYMFYRKVVDDDSAPA